MRRPFVTANFAITADGKISTRRFTPADFSSPRDKRRLLEIRAACDAVLVGARTLGKDTMTMGLPAEELRAARVQKGRAPYPLRVIVSNSGKLSPEAKVFTGSLPPPLVFTTHRMPGRIRQALLIHCDLYFSYPESDEVNLPAMLTTLRETHGVKRLVCEGGGTLLRALLAGGLVDELHITVCPLIFWGRKAPTISGIAGEFLPASTELRLVEMAAVGSECFTRWRVKRGRTGDA